ncbi:MAG: hypothetical protein ABEH86_09735 [Haloarcula sp.]
MNWLTNNRLLLLFAAVVLTTLGTIGLGIVGVVATVGALLSGGAVVQTFGVFLLGTLLLAGLDIVFSVALVRELAQQTSIPKSQRVADGLALAETIVPPLATLDLSDRLTPPDPTVEERHEKLTRRYVDGEISESTYERELQALLNEADDSNADPLDDLKTEGETTRFSEPDAERESARE